MPQAFRDVQGMLSAARGGRSNSSRLLNLKALLQRCGMGPQEVWQKVLTTGGYQFPKCTQLRVRVSEFEYWLCDLEQVT